MFVALMPFQTYKFLAYLRGIETNILSGSDSFLYEFLAYLRGIETGNSLSHGLLHAKFLAYLRGIETFPIKKGGRRR